MEHACPSWMIWAKKWLMEATSWSQDRVSEEHGNAFRMEHFQDKGIGLVCCRRLVAGTKLMEESPLLCVALEKNGSLVGRLEDDQIRVADLESQLESLNESDLSSFNELCDATDSCGSAFGILKTNAFSVRNPEPVLGIFPLVSRLNHACQPNCHHYWDARSKRMVVRTATCVEPGQELTISYMSPLLRHNFDAKSSRRTILRDEFNFECQCALCLIEDSNENDQFRRRLLAIEEIWPTLGDDPASALAAAEEQLALATSLSLHAGHLTHVSLHVVEAASLCVSRAKTWEWNNRSRAVEAAKNTENLALLAYGMGSEESRIMRKLVKLCSRGAQRDLWNEVQTLIASLDAVIE